MNAQIFKINKVKVNPNNPRIIKDEKFKKLVQSVQEFPEMLNLRPIVVNKEMMILGGNMRYKACVEAGLTEIPVIVAKDLTPEQEREFLIKDNVSGGEWDWDLLANEWEAVQLEDWGLDLIGFDANAEDFGEEFSLNDGDKEPFEQITFTLATEQAEQVKNALADIKATEEYKYAETMGNENSNGNALYLLVMQWKQQQE